MMADNRWYPLGLVLTTTLWAGCAGWAPSLASKALPWSEPNAPGSGPLDAQISLARLSERHDQPQNAERIYQAILEKDPNNQTAHHRLGVVAAKNGQFERAAQHFDVAAKTGPVSAELLNDIGYNLFAMDRHQEAEATFRRALEMAPQHTAARNNLALVLGSSGRYAESLAEFRKVVSEAEAYANLAFIRTRRGDYDGAAADYHRALTLNNELRPAAEALVQLSQYQAAHRQYANSPTGTGKSKQDATAQVAARSDRTPTGAEPKRADIPGFFEVIQSPAKGGPTRRTLASEALVHHDPAKTQPPPQRAESTSPTAPRYAAAAQSPAAAVPSAAPTLSPSQRFASAAKPRETAGQPAVPATPPSPRAAVAAKPPEAASHPAALTPSPSQRFAAASRPREAATPSATPTPPPSQRSTAAARPRGTANQPWAPTAPPPSRHLATARPAAPAFAPAPAASAMVQTDHGATAEPAQAKRPVASPQRPFVRAEIVYGRGTPTASAPPAAARESTPERENAPVQLASKRHGDAPAVMAAVHQAQVADPAEPGPVLESPERATPLSGPSGAAHPRLLVTPLSALRPAPSPSLSATTDPRLLPPPQLTAPLETLRPNADPANNVAVAPPANSLVQTPDAATGPEHASQDASATDGPALAPPLNHWQQPTWTPSMGSLPPIGVNGWRLHGASHATAAPPPSLR